MINGIDTAVKPNGVVTAAQATFPSLLHHGLFQCEPYGLLE